MKPIRFTQHLRAVAGHRAISLTWIERTVRTPAWTEPEPRDPALRRAFAPIPERENRVLRVVYGETPDEYVIVTAFIDRNARQDRGGPG